MVIVDTINRKVTIAYMTEFVLYGHVDFFLSTKSGCNSLLLPRLPKLPSQWYSNGLGNLGNSKEIQAEIRFCTENSQHTKV